MATRPISQSSYDFKIRYKDISPDPETPQAFVGSMQHVHPDLLGVIKWLSALCKTDLSSADLIQRICRQMEKIYSCRCYMEDYTKKFTIHPSSFDDLERKIFSEELAHDSELLQVLNTHLSIYLS